jgi:hypothetical protein
MFVLFVAATPAGIACLKIEHGVGDLPPAFASIAKFFAQSFQPPHRFLRGAFLLCTSFVQVSL